MKTYFKHVTSKCLIAMVFLNAPSLSWAQEHASITPVIQTEANIPGDIFNGSLARLPQAWGNLASEPLKISPGIFASVWITGVIEACSCAQDRDGAFKNTIAIRHFEVTCLKYVFIS